jgi:hypothetical protein
MKPFVSCLVCILLASFFVSCNGENALRTTVSGSWNNVPSYEEPQVLVLRASFSLDDKEPAFFYSAINAAGEADAESAACLLCHGPTFEDLAAKTADFIDPWGENVNPHVYVEMTKSNPHESTVIVSCLQCHEQHALPLPSGAVRAASLRYCYSCHHTEDLVACNTCHNE